ncbi:glycosyltransferase family 25 protein [Acidobacterium capsulatum]|uniref:LPS glycosyltransferase family protein n=1 Tax=Acidobacterium capsulatum (strain ATCC 51196 / DSM 11244 / BCRC 80197 / JCM 7670 / NBRC 15755 / NCIMB 13165 / 161) TaxID=240015 RepID=C1F4P3_ACIC5|nr:glycosyltransferase family 25 protein [Acidobacterium capsulatum]ACO33284.1 LPS glycosyltransferase family protein [Acidobacterium capsulatum ATCC 51196]
MPVTIDTFFAKKICINLDRRPDRWQAVQQKFTEHRISNVERLSAVDARTAVIPDHLSHLRPQDYACTMSHLAAVKQAKREGCENVLIFEDDVTLDPALNDLFPGYMAELPEDWHMFFLGCYHLVEPIAVSPHIVRGVEALTAHAYCVRATLFDEFIALNENPPAIVDRNNTILQRRFHCYCFQPNLAGQEQGYSDVMEEVMPEKPLAHNYPIVGQW